MFIWEKTNAPTESPALFIYFHHDVKTKKYDFHNLIQ